MILNEFDENRVAVINPEDIRKKLDNMPKTCLMLFSSSAIKIFLENYEHEAISAVKNATGTFTIYKINVEGRDLAVMHAALGAPAVVANTEEVISLGARNILAVGCCGCLVEDLEDQAILIPTAAFRDEGTSYHYAPPSDETIINPKMVEIVETFMNEKGISFTKGKTWTTDAIYRETRDKMNRRVAAGAITVDMECSALNVLAEFRGVNFAQFFYAADNLAKEEYDPRSLITTVENIDMKTKSKIKIVKLAIECALAIDRNAK